MFHAGIAVLLFTVQACNPAHKIGKSASALLLNDSTFVNAHTGISIFDPQQNQYLYNYQAEKYFVPASNTKIVTLYMGMKTLGDHQPGLRYRVAADTIYLQPTGDPSFLHPDFKDQPVFDFLKQTTLPLAIDASNWKSEPLGAGWSWDDYNDDYAPERSALPIYANLIKWIQVKDATSPPSPGSTSDNTFIYSEPEVNWKVNFSNDNEKKTFAVKRAVSENEYTIRQGQEPFRAIEVPFVTHGVLSALELLKDTLHKTIVPTRQTANNGYTLIASIRSDSLYRKMMGRSDNFFAEQILLMSANERWRVLDEQKTIDSALHGELKGFPQPPNWVDGSGLSHYNLFTPFDMVWILDRMQKEFGMNRVKSLFATGGTGTLRNYFRQDSGYVYAKTGTLAGVVALSGYMYTRKNRLLIFSVLVNNHQSPGGLIRRKVETFLRKIRDEY